MLNKNTVEKLKAVIADFNFRKKYYDKERIAEADACILTINEAIADIKTMKSIINKNFKQEEIKWSM